MADHNTVNAEAPNADQSLEIQRILTQERVCKVPNCPEIFKEEGEPATTMELSNRYQVLNDEEVEVSLTINITAKINNRTAYTVEMRQVGLFVFKGFTDEQKLMLFNTECLNVLYSYLRQNVASDVMNAGFPPLHLSPINFHALYQQRQQQAGQDKQPGQQDRLKTSLSTASTQPVKPEATSETIN